VVEALDDDGRRARRLLALHAAERTGVERAHGPRGYGARDSRLAAPWSIRDNPRRVRIQLYVLRQLLFSLLFSIAGLSLIVLPTIAIQAVNKLGAISAGTVVQYLPLVVAELVPTLMPMAFLLAVVATYGRLAAERELIAIKMAGIHPARLALPALMVALPLALGTDHLLGQLSPELKYQQRTVIREADVTRFKTMLQGHNVVPFGKHVLRGENRGDVMLNAQLDMVLDDESRVSVSAAEARIDIEGDLLVVRMKQARVLTEDASFDNAAPIRSWKLSELFPRTPKNRSDPKYLTSDEMDVALAGKELTPAQREEYLYEIHRRHALSVTYLLFLLLGIPTGVVLRSSTQLGAFTGAVGYAFLYYVLAMRLGKVLAETGALPPLLAAWATNGLFLAVGLVFFVRALWR
jgi:lipopolysaccharide export LptBFGC system permease protein LptF